MSRYVPLLKGKRGEIQALSLKKAFSNSEMLPVFDLVTNDSDKEPREAETFAEQLIKMPPSSPTPLGLDTTYLPSNRQPGGQRPLEWLTTKLNADLPAQFPIVPVVHEDSSAVHIQDVNKAAQVFGAGIVLRLGSDARPPASLTARDLATILQGAGVGIGDVDIIVDYRAVRTPNAVEAARTGLSSLWSWASSLGSRSVTLASGAFPANLSSLAWGNCSSVPRYDRQLWQTNGHSFDFGDYGVTAPSAATGGRGPAPSLRYTGQDEWFVWREHKNTSGPQPFAPMRRIYLAATRNPSWAGASYSWGDWEIDTRAAAANSPVGNATQWRAFATSHHLEKVVDELL